MKCETPLVVESKDKFRYVNGEYTNKIPVACGRCPACRVNKVRDWCFRLIEEEKGCKTSYFVTLTYDTWSVPITDNGYMTLRKKDLQDWMKRLRQIDNRKWKKNGWKIKDKPKLVYYACGEYGSKNYRPHYHIILFNVWDIDSIVYAWRKKHNENKKDIGMIHIGQVSGKSVAYTLKYLDKTVGIPKHRNDDRIKEFSVMSNNIGSRYLTDQMIMYHKSDLSRIFVENEGYMQKLPKYYVKRIYDEADMVEISRKVQEYYDQKEEKLARRIKRIYKGKVSVERYKDDLRKGRYNKFHNINKKQRDV